MGFVACSTLCLCFLSTIVIRLNQAMNREGDNQEILIKNLFNYNEGQNKLKKR